MVTRDALSYIAEVKRDRSMFMSTPKQTIDQVSSISIDQITNNDVKDEEAHQLRDEKLMQLFDKCEIKKWGLTWHIWEEGRQPESQINFS